jgi:hypothetical protein
MGLEKFSCFYCFVEVPKEQQNRQKKFYFDFFLLCFELMKVFETAPHTAAVLLCPTVGMSISAPETGLKIGPGLTKLWCFFLTRELKVIILHLNHFNLLT